MIPATIQQPSPPHHRRLRSTTARALALALASVGMLLFSPAQSASASCSHTHADYDSGYGSVTTESVRMRVGPHHTCGIETYTSPNDILEYECYRVGDNVYGVSTWTYVHKYNAWSAAGWVSDYYLDDGGAVISCP